MGRKARLKKECNEAIRTGTFDRLSEKAAKRINRLYSRDIQTATNQFKVQTYKEFPCQKNDKYMALVPVDATIVTEDGKAFILELDGSKTLIVSHESKLDDLRKQQAEINKQNKLKEAQLTNVVNFAPVKLGE